MHADRLTGRCIGSGTCSRAGCVYCQLQLASQPSSANLTVKDFTVILMLHEFIIIIRKAKFNSPTPMSNELFPNAQPIDVLSIWPNLTF